MIHFESSLQPMMCVEAKLTTGVLKTIVSLFYAHKIYMLSNIRRAIVSWSRRTTTISVVAGVKKGRRAASVEISEGCIGI